MASLYRRKSRIYYLSVVFQGKRQTRSLETTSLELAKELTPALEKTLINEIINGKQMIGTIQSKWCMEYDPNRAGKENPLDILRRNGVEV